MKFQENNHHSTPCPESHPKCTFNPAKQLIRSDIVETMIRISEFARDSEDEVYLVMPEVESSYYLPLQSKEVEIAIYRVGLVRGVKLDIDDIRNIVEELTQHIYCKRGKVTFLGDVSPSMEAC